jgi:hypothetical protein
LRCGGSSPPSPTRGSSSGFSRSSPGPRSRRSRCRHPQSPPCMPDALRWRGPIAVCPRREALDSPPAAARQSSCR